MSRLFHELQRRNVFRIGIAYLIASWLLLQITDILVPILLLPDWVPRFIFLLLAIGFIPALIFAWAYELTPEGLKREKDVDPGESVAGDTGRRLNYLIIGTLTVAVAVLLLDKYLLTAGPSAVESGGRPSTIAVLPFESMSSNPEDENFADGLTEELLNSLAKIGELGVVGRTSSFYYKGKPQDLREIGAALEVAHVLEGSVRRDGDRLRITAQLIQTDSGLHVWSDTFDRTLDDIFAIQEEISGQVANALQVAILGTEAEALRNHGTSNPDAHARYLIASSYIRRGQSFGLDPSQELDNLVAARRLLEEAIELDPEFAEAWAELTIVYYQLTGAGVLDASGTMLAMEDAVQLAELASARAAGLALELPLAWSALAVHRHEAQRLGLQTQEDPERAFQQALELDPDHVRSLELYAGFLVETARFDQAVEFYDRAIDLDPLSFVRLRRAEALYLSGNANKAWREYLNVAELYPEAPVNRGIAQFEFDRGHFHHGITLLSAEQGAAQPIYAWASLGDEERAHELIQFFDSLGGEFTLMGPIVGSLIDRDYRRLMEDSSQFGSFELPAAWVAGIYLRDWDFLRALLEDVPSQIFYVRRYFELFTGNATNLERFRRFPGALASAVVYYAHLQDQLGNEDQARRSMLRAREITNMIPDTTPRNIQERHHARLLIFASEGDTEAALDEFEAMADAGWRWLMSGGSFDYALVYAVDWGWFEDSPLLDSVRNQPRFIATLERVKADNERMRRELERGISIDEILAEGVD